MKKYVTLLKISSNKHLYHIGIPLITEIILLSGRATYLPRDWSFVRADAYGVYCHGNETDAHDCHVNKNDTTYGMCGTMDDAGVECEGKVLLLFQKSFHSYEQIVSMVPFLM
jgi:hypothetical protein